MAENKNVQVQEVEIPTEAPKVTTGLVVRTIIYLIAIVNAAAAFLGFNFVIPADYDFIYRGVSLAFGLGSFVHAYWRNNDISKGARTAREVAKQLDLKK